VSDSWHQGGANSDEGVWEEGLSDGKSGKQRPSVASAAGWTGCGGWSRKLLRNARRSLCGLVQSARFQALVIFCAVVALVTYPASVASTEHPDKGVLASPPWKSRTCEAQLLILVGVLSHSHRSPCASPLSASAAMDGVLFTCMVVLLFETLTRSLYGGRGEFSQRRVWLPTHPTISSKCSCPIVKWPMSCERAQVPPLF
jgi:hypothetical protein